MIRFDDQAHRGSGKTSLEERACFESGTDIIGGDDQVISRRLLEPKVPTDRHVVGYRGLQAGHENGGHTIGDIDRSGHRCGSHGYTCGRVHQSAGIIIGNGDSRCSS